MVPKRIKNTAVKMTGFVNESNFIIEIPSGNQIRLWINRRRDTFPGVVRCLLELKYVNFGYGSFRFLYILTLCLLSILQ